jgi:hypothetical protein
MNSLAQAYERAIQEYLDGIQQAFGAASLFVGGGVGSDKEEIEQKKQLVTLKQKFQEGKEAEFDDLKSNLIACLLYQINYAIRSHAGTKECTEKLQEIRKNFLELVVKKGAQLAPVSNIAQADLLLKLRKLYEALQPLIKISRVMRPTEMIPYIEKIILLIDKAKEAFANFKFFKDAHAIDLQDTEKAGQEYLARAAKEITWAALPELYVLSKIFKLNITLFKNNQGVRQEDHEIKPYLYQPDSNDVVAKIPLDFTNNSKFIF